MEVGWWWDGGGMEVGWRWDGGGSVSFQTFDFHSPLQTKQRSTDEASRSAAEITPRRTP